MEGGRERGGGGGGEKRDPGMRLGMTYNDLHCCSTLPVHVKFKVTNSNKVGKNILEPLLYGSSAIRLAYLNIYYIIRCKLL